MRTICIRTHQKLLPGFLLELGLVRLVLRKPLPLFRSKNFRFAFFFLCSCEILLNLLVQVLSATPYGLEEQPSGGSENERR